MSLTVSSLLPSPIIHAVTVPNYITLTLYPLLCQDKNFWRQHIHAWTKHIMPGVLCSLRLILQGEVNDRCMAARAGNAQAHENFDNSDTAGYVCNNINTLIADYKMSSK